MRAVVGVVIAMAGVAGCADGPRLGEGAVSCEPNRRSCAGGIAEVCNADGDELVRFECDPVQGMVCAPDGCTGACSPTWLGHSYIGCDYHPTVTLNPVWTAFTFGVAVASTSEEPTRVLVTRGDEVVDERTLAPGGLEMIALPWVTELKGGDFMGAGTQAPDSGPSRLVPDGAYRLRTDRPVTAYQMSPVEYTLGPISESCPGAGWGACNSYSNDASLLLPTNTLGRSYTALSWPASSGGPSMIAVTAVRDNTVVTLDGSAAVRPGGGMGPLASGTVTLQGGDVLMVLSEKAVEPTTLFAEYMFGPDLSGTRIEASEPVQVIAGHGCANIPFANTGYCDHMEELVLPHHALGNEYVVTTPLPPSTAPESRIVVRVAAVTPDTVVRFEPAVIGETLLTVEQPFVEIADVTGDLVVRSDRPVVVAQYMQGSTSLAEVLDRPEGDPAQSFAVPTRQFRQSYRFFSSATYEANYVNVIAPAGARVMLDGALLPASSFRQAGGSDWVVARVPLEGEVHVLEADVPVGILVYGYGDWTSYMYPGGLDLDLSLI